MLKYYQAEVLKNRRRPAGKIIIAMPAAIAVCSAVLAGEYVVVNNYNWWYIVLFPGVMAVICAGIGGLDRKNGDRNVLTLPSDMKRIWDGKVLYGVRTTALSAVFLWGFTLASRTVLKYGLHVKLVLDAGVLQQIAAAAVLFVTFLWLVPFCLILERFFGAPFMLLIHLFIYTAASCSLSLTPYFLLLPGAIPARMMCVVLKILPNGLPAREGMMTYSPELLDQAVLWPGLTASLVWFFLLWGISRRLYERQVTGR